MNVLLYLIEFLHQTTTVTLIRVWLNRCILLNFYIKPQRNTYIDAIACSCILLNFYIKPQQNPGGL